MRHMLMDPAFPDIVGEWAQELIDDRARVWVVTMGPDGRLHEEIDPQLLATVGASHRASEVADLLTRMAGEKHLAANRLW